MRAIWILFIVALAFCTAGAQLDRAARREPSLATIVPPPFRMFAQERITMATVRSASPETALTETRSLIERSPLPAEHLTFLAIARERSGDRNGSGEMIQRAALRGWRDPIAQQAMFEIALASGDHAEATRRLAALLGLQEDQAPVKEMAERLLSQPAGREAMVGALVGGGIWTRGFMSMAAGDGSPYLGQTAIDALRAGAQIDCRTASTLKRALEQKGKAVDPSLFGKCMKRVR